MSLINRLFGNLSSKYSTSKKLPLAFPRSLKYQVWRKHNGTTLDGSCYICSESLRLEDAVLGHVNAKALGGSMSPSNLRPIHQMCNLSMGTMNMYDFINSYYKK
jgi:5-methylcytosine-specific restriction endonuclease McrA